MKNLLRLFVMLAPLAALADVEQKFAKLRDGSEPLTSIGGFIDKYAGDCGPALLGGAECARNAEAFRKAHTDKKHYLIITEETVPMMTVGEMNPRDGTVVLNLTPFLSGSTSAVTHGAPQSTDSNGNPVLPYIRVTAKMPDGWSPPMMARQVGARAFRIQVVFTPQGLWTLPKKGGGALKGVKARFDAVLVQVGRTGDVLGTWYSK